jgi:polyisoprenyl-teichoic acid--peptidoglycan teichoic acid transferase
VLLVLAIGAFVSPDRVARLALLLNPDVIATILVIEAALVAWRLVAVLDAYRRGQGRARERGAALTAVALVLVLVPSAYAAYLTDVARQAAIAVFSPAEQPWVPNPGTTGVRDDDFAVAPTPSIQPSEAPELGRFTVLLLGLDSGANRDHALTDTMIVASLDPIAGAVSMVSVPRDLVDTPLPDGRIFRPKINGLVSYANRYPDKFPGATSGQAVLAAALGELLQVRVDGWAQVNLPGFVRVIDAIGGIDITVRKSFCDARYDEYGFDGFAITPGRWHLDGQAALAYARIRKAAGETDFTRAARQGDIVVAARDRVVEGGLLTDPTGFISAMGELLQTSLDPAVIGQYVGAAIGIGRDHMYRAVIQFPLVRGGERDDPRGSILVPNLRLIRDLAEQAFPPAGTLPTGLETFPKEEEDLPSRTNLPPVNCYAPPPTPRPTEAPTVPPSAPPPTTDPADPTEPPATPRPTDKPGGGPKTPAPTEPPPDPTPEPITP